MVTKETRDLVTEAIQDTWAYQVKEFFLKELLVLHLSKTSTFQNQHFSNRFTHGAFAALSYIYSYQVSSPT